MATVLLAHDLKHDRPVALKVLSANLGAALGAARFRREIAMAARLHHPHVLSVFDSGEAAGRLWYSIPYVAGESLRDQLKRELQRPVTEAVRIARQAAQGLHYAHRQGIVHRDVKPENILLTEDGTTLVADLGIAHAPADEDTVGAARLTGSGLTIGTTAHMSPEQAAGERNLAGRSDVYARARRGPRERPLGSGGRDDASRRAPVREPRAPRRCLHRRRPRQRADPSTRVARSG